VKGEDVDVRLDRDVLTISGERRSEQDPQQQSNYHVMERSYGRFSRSMQLPSCPIRTRSAPTSSTACCRSG